MATSNISFNDGFKEFTINNDESRVIRFNPSDIGMLDRIVKAQKNITKISENAQEIEALLDKVKSRDTENLESEFSEDIINLGKGVGSIDECIKEQINYIFNGDVADIAFGKTSPTTLVKGIPLYERFLSAAVPIIEKACNDEKKSAQKRIQKYRTHPAQGKKNKR